MPAWALLVWLAIGALAGLLARRVVGGVPPLARLETSSSASPAGSLAAMVSRCSESAVAERERIEESIPDHEMAKQTAELECR